jgi:GH15 family glucan-1,4-alpha-glucosidase
MGTKAAMGTAPSRRIDGYAPIRDYAALGDGRTVALVARDGSIDWLPLPDLDSPSVFAALLDAERGGRFELAPDVPYETERRYVPGTNVLETTFHTDRGTVRVTDALTLPGHELDPYRELARSVDCLAGAVPMHWRVEPRFDFGSGKSRLHQRVGVPIATAGADALAVCSFDAGSPECSDHAIEGRFELIEGSRAVLALAAAHQEPLVLPTRSMLEEGLERTKAVWRRWSGDRGYDGPWRESVIRSILALKLLVFAQSGAVAAAATTSLPEVIGGERNWDYRYSWVRDSAFTVDAMLELGCSDEAHAYFWWLMHASQLTHPCLEVLYSLDGGGHTDEQELGLSGYRGSTPVHVGNSARGQRQLDAYGDLLQTAWLYAEEGHRIDRDIAERLAESADFVCDNWRRPDSGIWEVRSGEAQHTQSKMMCWVALDRAAALAERGVVPGKKVQRWRHEQERIAEFVETRCWSDDRQSYVRAAGDDELDASVLLGGLFGYRNAADERMKSTIDSIRRHLADGPLVHRYTGEDGLAGEEGAFVACSFWLAEALAQAGRVDEAAELMDELVGLGNDVGLFSEEIDPATGEFLGNLPQGLSHLALISAAVAIAEKER